MCGPEVVTPLTDVDLLTAAVDRLLAASPAELSPAQALRRSRTLLAQTERLRAAGLAAVRDVDSRQLYELDGSANASVWVGRQVGGRLAPVTLARRLAARPVVGEALAAGRLDVLAAERVCLALAKLPDATSGSCVGEDAVSWLLAGEVPSLLQELGGGVDPDPTQSAAVLGQALTAVEVALPVRLEPVFVLLAGRVGAHLLMRCLQSLVDALLPEEHLERWQEQQAETYLDVRELLDGYGDVRGVLDPETFALLRGALHARRLDRQAEDTLTAGQRKVLALRQVLRDATVPHSDADEPEPDDADGLAVPPDGDPDAAPAAEGVGVQLTLVTRAPAALSGGRPVPLLTSIDSVLGRPGSLPGRYGPGMSTSLPVDAVRRLGCGGQVAAILLDAYGMPVGASGTHRHATERERRALLAQWGGLCATDGCARPGVVPHHAEPWWLTRRTRLADLVPYCDGCHHDLHEGGQTLKLRNGRWIGPTGWTDPPADGLDTA